MFLFSIWTLTVPRTLNSLWKGARHAVCRARHAAEPGGGCPRVARFSAPARVPRLRGSRAAPGESAAEGLSEPTRNGIRETCPEPGAPPRRAAASRARGRAGPARTRFSDVRSRGAEVPKLPTPGTVPPAADGDARGPGGAASLPCHPSRSPAAPSRVAPPRPLRQPSAPRVRLALDGRTGQPRPRGRPQVQCCHSCSRAPVTPRSSRREPGVLSRPPEPASFLRSWSTRATCSSRCSRTCHEL